MSKPMYLPKGWRAGPDKLGRKFVHDEAGGLYVQVPRGSVFGPELLVNGDFAGGATGWTVTGADGTHIATFDGVTLRYQSDTLSPQLIVDQAILTIGRVYEVTVVTSAWVSGSLKTDSITGSPVFGAAVGTVTFRGTATANGIAITRNTTNVDVTIESISVREVRA